MYFYICGKSTNLFSDLNMILKCTDSDIFLNGNGCGIKLVVVHSCTIDLQLRVNLRDFKLLSKHQ